MVLHKLGKLTNVLSNSLGNGNKQQVWCARNLDVFALLRGCLDSERSIKMVKMYLSLWSVFIRTIFSVNTHRFNELKQPAKAEDLSFSQYLCTGKH